MMNYKLRKATQDDKWMVLEWRNHPEVRAVMLTDHIITDTEHSAWWEKTMQMEDRQILIFLRDEMPVGVVTIYAWDKECSTAWWGFYLDNTNLLQSDKTSIWLALEDAVIQYGRESLKLYELYCESLRENELAWTLHSKCGFIECSAPKNATKTEKTVVYMKYVYPENQLDERTPLYLFASHNTDFLTEILKKESKGYFQLPYKIERAEFGRYQLDLLDENNNYINDPSATYLFVERIEDLFLDIYSLPTEDVLIATENRVSEYLSFIRQIASRGQKVYVADFAIQKSFPFSIKEQLTNSKINQLVERCNQQLYTLATESIVEVLPYSSLIQRIGQSFSNKFWYMARTPFSIEYLEAYSRMIIGVLLASNGLSARALVLDLDNTLWQGVVGDDGKEGIILGGDYPGNIYKELQSLFLELKQRGILLTICSKNTDEIALDAIENHPEMRLRKSDFASYRINWNSKSENIKQLAKELNVGVQSLCFIDDNPVERAEVRLNVPNVFVPELPNDPAEWYQFICQLPELYVTQVSDSDRRRATLYQARASLNLEASTFADRTEFIKSLEMDISIEGLNTSNFERTYQLFTKTNQFNTTTTRYSREQLNDWLSSSQYKVLHIKLKDKYSSEYEGVAAIVIFTSQEHWVIDNFVMSCRVMGRDIEKAILTKIKLMAHENGVKSIVGRYVKSSKNMPVEQLYQNQSFVKNGKTEWIFDLTKESVPEESNLMKIRWNV